MPHETEKPTRWVGWEPFVIIPLWIIMACSLLQTAVEWIEYTR